MIFHITKMKYSQLPYCHNSTIIPIFAPSWNQRYSAEQINGKGN